MTTRNRQSFEHNTGIVQIETACHRCRIAAINNSMPSPLHTCYGKRIGNRYLGCQVIDAVSDQNRITVYRRGDRGLDIGRGGSPGIKRRDMTAGE